MPDKILVRKRDRNDLTCANQDEMGNEMRTHNEMNFARNSFIRIQTSTLYLLIGNKYTLTLWYSLTVQQLSF